MATSEVAVIVGAGAGLSAALARRCAADGMRVALAARDTGKLSVLAAATGASVHACDATRPDQVDALFAAVDRELGAADLVIYNAGLRLRGAVQDLPAQAIQDALAVNAFGSFLVAQAAARRMVPRGSGTILLTGASASVKGYGQSTPFAMGKFAQRGMAQSLARELAPQGVHVGHVVIDGRIRPAGEMDDTDHLLDPDAVASAYLALHRQPRSAWSWEIEIRPWVETF